MTTFLPFAGALAAAVLGMALAAPLSSAQAQSTGAEADDATALPPTAEQIVSNPAIPELKLGVLLHDVFHDYDNSRTVSFNAELVWSDLEYWSFESPFVEVLLNPVPMIGGTVNTSGGVNTFYAGAAWPWEFDVGLTVTNSFGFTLHDGRTDLDTTACPPTLICPLAGNRIFVATDDGPILGSPILFRYGLDIAWRLDETHSISAFYSHSSNAGLADFNEGIDFAGIRYGIRLGTLFD